MANVLVLSQTTGWCGSGRVRGRRHGCDWAENDCADLDPEQIGYSHAVRQLLFGTKALQRVTTEPTLKLHLRGAPTFRHVIGAIQALGALNTRSIVRCIAGVVELMPDVAQAIIRAPWCARRHVL